MEFARTKAYARNVQEIRFTQPVEILAVRVVTKVG